MYYKNNTLSISHRAKNNLKKIKIYSPKTVLCNVLLCKANTKMLWFGWFYQDPFHRPKSYQFLGPTNIVTSSNPPTGKDAIPYQFPLHNLVVFHTFSLNLLQVYQVPVQIYG